MVDKKRKDYNNAAASGATTMVDNDYGQVVSRLSTPLMIKYGNDHVMLPPRGKLDNLKKSKLDPLPVGVTFLPKN